ncbi:MFS transporter [Streptomyces sp. SM12]|uniref:MFS transporter n=1 Tax=Streptomyces sp. SM12 TaxID=1071602 RepID=UPI000CD52A69|nr:MFS transporter [Streptomyces sp. SM12]
MRTYQELLRLPGARSSVVGGFLGRLPNGMRILGCLLMVSATTGSYAQAGLVTALMTVCQAVAAPVLGRAADRRGQRPVLLLSLAGQIVGLSALVLAAVTLQPLWTLLAAAIVTGLTSLSVGSLVRARWVALVGSSPRLPSAYALESVVDETVFVVGPLLATSLAVALFPAAGLVGALVLLTAGTLILVATAPAPPPPAADAVGQRSRGVLRTRGLPLLLLVFALLGTFFGAIDVAILAFAEENGNPGFAGPLLALVALGSLIAGLTWGAVRSWSIGLPARLLGCAGAFAVAGLPLPWVTATPLMALCMLLCGAAIAPAMITGTLLIERLLPRGRLTEGFAWMSSSIAVGMAAGAALGGRLADGTSSRGTLVMATTTVLLCLVVAASGHRGLGRACRDAERSAPVAAVVAPASTAAAAPAGVEIPGPVPVTATATATATAPTTPVSPEAGTARPGM